MKINGKWRGVVEILMDCLRGNSGSEAHKMDKGIETFRNHKVEMTIKPEGKMND